MVQYLGNPLAELIPAIIKREKDPAIVGKIAEHLSKFITEGEQGPKFAHHLRNLIAQHNSDPLIRKTLQGLLAKPEFSGSEVEVYHKQLNRDNGLPATKSCKQTLDGK